MTKMSGGKAIVESLIANGVDTVFGLPGVQLDHLFNAFHDEGNRIRVLNARHEQGTAYMAYGYAQSSGRVGVYAVVPGPGILNTTAALATAYAARSPVLAITGQINADAIGQGYGLLHEIPDQLGLLSTLTKWSARIDYPTEAPGVMRHAFRQLREGVPGPVSVEMAMDTLGVEAEVTMPEATVPEAPAPVDHDRIVEAAKLLGQSERPLMVVGGGALGACEAVREVAEMLEAPVIAHRMGRGIIDERHHLSHTQPVGHRLWGNADVILAVGTRLQQHRMVWGVGDDQKIVRIDLDATQMHRLGAPEIGIVADARLALVALAGELTRTNRKRASREEELTALRAAVMSEFDSKLAPQMGFLKALRRALPEDGLFCDELTQVGYVSRAAFPVYAPRTFVSSGYQGTLGSGFPTALGAKVAHPDRPVLSVSGDGGFMFNVQELSSAVAHGIGVVTVVFNDGAYGNVKRMQQNLYGGRVIASDLKNPDFVRLAESFGARGVRADGPQALEAAVTEALRHGEPTLIDVPVGEMPAPWGVSQPMSRSRR